MNNGRVDVIGEKKKDSTLKQHRCNWFDGCPLSQPFMLSDKIPLNTKATEYRNALVGNWDNNALASAYFSAENIQIIQNGIRNGVYKASKNKHIIAPQNTDTIKIIMRSIFLQHSKNQEVNITEQIKDLNNMVIQYAVPSLLGQIVGYLNYKKDISTLAEPISRPQYTSMAGINTSELKRWF